MYGTKQELLKNNQISQGKEEETMLLKIISVVKIVLKGIIAAASVLGW